METNMNPEIHQELREKGQALIEAAREFWKLHQRLAGPRAVVWLKDTSGHFIAFTRGEYGDQLMNNIAPIAEEQPLDDPFVAHESRRVFLVQRGYFDGHNLGVFSSEEKAKEASSKAAHTGDHMERFDRIVEFVLDQPDGEVSPPQSQDRPNQGLIGQTGNRPGGTMTGSYKHVGNIRREKE